MPFLDFLKQTFNRLILPPSTYTVKPGDTLSGISKQVYGNADLYGLIFDANRDQLKDPNKIKPGQVLRIPKR